ncbi:MAG: hypothetical protein NTW16_04995, partial [Bacteroidetes bacterium]|nr:hypothetical protein [Bacteroidota bacterium]
EVNVGSFPTVFLETTTVLISDMVPSHLTIYENWPVSAVLSGGNVPDGAAIIKFYCYYVIIAL